MLLQKFSFTETQDVMTLVHPVHGILFDATNVCEILEYSRKAGNVIEKLDDDEKVLLNREEYNPSSEVTPPVTSGNLRPGSTKNMCYPFPYFILLLVPCLQNGFV